MLNIFTRYRTSNLYRDLSLFPITEFPYLTKHVVAQLVEALRYKPEGHEFSSRCGHWRFFSDLILLVALVPVGRLSHQQK